VGVVVLCGVVCVLCGVGVTSHRSIPTTGSAGSAGFYNEVGADSRES